MTITDTWRCLAARLAAELTAKGKLTDPAWRAAVENVPRHHLVPVFYERDREGWHAVDTSTPTGLEAVYSNRALFTMIDETGFPRSSTSQPGLMTRMLEALDIRDGHRVLEIGVGTGYNAALMCHRLGDGNVVSVDVEPELVECARRRLAELGYRPTLLAGDGVEGIPAAAPFDRIIATCAVPRVPWEWVEQLAIGGRVLVDVKVAGQAGSLVNLVRTEPDLAEGRFDPVFAAFMNLRPAGWSWEVNAMSEDVPGWESVTRVDPRTPHRNHVVWFLATFRFGAVSIGYRGESPSSPTAVTLRAADGSWSRVSIAEGPRGHWVVGGGPRSLWREVEAAHAEWVRHGQPGWGRFGYTAGPSEQTVWLDGPGGPTWTVPPASE